MKVSEFEERLNQLTANELEEMCRKLYDDTPGALDNFGPYWDYQKNKATNIRKITRWVASNNKRIAMVLSAVNEKISAKNMVPKTGPVPGTRYISWNDFRNLPSFMEVQEAVEFGYDPSAGNTNNPVTKDGYLSVYALRNMRSWKNWKSSSLSDYERAKADALDRIGLTQLIKLNDGRMPNQPALFPLSMLPM